MGLKGLIRTLGGIESVLINRMSVLGVLNEQKMYGLSFPRTKQTVCNDEVSV